MRIFLVAILTLIPTLASAQQRTYSLSNLSAEDVFTIGRGLDKLPREDTDKRDLYRRIQQQITVQDQMADKATADELDKKVDKKVEEKLKQRDDEDKKP